MRKYRIKNIKFYTFVTMSVIVIYIFSSEGIYFLSIEGRKEFITRIDLLVNSAGWLGPIFYCLVYAIGTLFLPATLFTAAGVLMFGTYFGTVINFLGAIFGASISFIIGRYFLRDFAKGILISKVKELDRKAREHGFSIVFSLRMIWFPFMILNYAAGATKIKFQDYFIGTFFGIFPSILLSSLFVGNIKYIMSTFHTYSDIIRTDVIISVVLMIVYFFIPSFVKRIRKSKAG